MIDFIIAGGVAVIATAIISGLVALVLWLGWLGAAVSLFLVLWIFFWRLFE